LDVRLGQAGVLIAIFSLTFALCGPLWLVFTAGYERTRLTMVFVLIFVLGRTGSSFRPTYSGLFLSRLISALSGALLVILCLIIAPSIVEPKYRGRAIGIVSMGVSGSIVLGLPIGLFLGDAFSWRAPFVLIAILTIISMAGVYFFMDKV